MNNIAAGLMLSSPFVFFFSWWAGHGTTRTCLFYVAIAAALSVVFVLPRRAQRLRQKY